MGCDNPADRSRDMVWRNALQQFDAREDDGTFSDPPSAALVFPGQERSVIARREPAGLRRGRAEWRDQFMGPFALHGRRATVVRNRRRNRTILVARQHSARLLR